MDYKAERIAVGSYRRRPILAIKDEDFDKDIRDELAYCHGVEETVPFLQLQLVRELRRLREAMTGEAPLP